ncbi:hypothetical protein [Arthrobacter humicola]
MTFMTMTARRVAVVVLASMLPLGLSLTEAPASVADSGNHYGQTRNGNHGHHYGQIKHGGGGCSPFCG